MCLVNSILYCFQVFGNFTSVESMDFALVLEQSPG